MAEVAHVLCTPLDVLGEFYPDELVAWHREAERIIGARGVTGG